LINIITDGGDLLVTDADEELIASYQAQPLYQWHCREFSDRTTKICSSLDVSTDLVKGDGVTVATFPTFVVADTDTGTPSHYVFDGANDYVGNCPTMPTEYTVVAIVDDGSGPELWTCNDTEIEDALGASAGFTGKLYRLAIFDEVLDAEQLAFLEYYWVSKIPRLGARGIEHRLIIDNSCVFHHRYLNGNSTDISGNAANGTDTHLSYSSAGALFGFVDSSILVSSLKVPILTSMSMVCDATVIHDTGHSDKRYLIKKGSEYSLYWESNRPKISCGGVLNRYVYSNDSLHHNYIAIIENGKIPRLFIDGEEKASYENLAVSIPSSSSNVEIGIQDAYWEPITMESARLYNRALNTYEITALYNRSKIG
jgi:hypothetical protein